MKKGDKSTRDLLCIKHSLYMLCNVRNMNLSEYISIYIIIKYCNACNIIYINVYMSNNSRVSQSKKKKKKRTKRKEFI